VTASEIWAVLLQALPVVAGVAGLLEWRLRQLDERQAERHQEVARRLDGMETAQVELRNRMDRDRDHLSNSITELTRETATESFVLEQVGPIKARLEHLAERCFAQHAERR
jgi:hypothetical protein